MGFLGYLIIYIIGIIILTTFIELNHDYKFVDIEWILSLSFRDEYGIDEGLVLLFYIFWPLAVAVTLFIYIARLPYLLIKKYIEWYIEK